MLEAIAKFTLADYHRMIEVGIFDRRRVELIEGIIIEIPPEGSEHSYYGQTLADRLRFLLFDRALVRENKPITLADSEPEPDITIARLPATRYRLHHPYPEDILWIVEISRTTLAFDTNEKKRVYARAGILEYWVMDIRRKILIVYGLSSGEDYQEIFTLSSDRCISPVAFPDLAIDLSGVFSNSGDG
jgi:Uma2 family endonuclease